LHEDDVWLYFIKTSGLPGVDSSSGWAGICQGAYFRGPFSGGGHMSGGSVDSSCTLGVMHTGSSCPPDSRIVTVQAW